MITAQKLRASRISHVVIVTKFSAVKAAWSTMDYGIICHQRSGAKNAIKRSVPKRTWSFTVKRNLDKQISNVRSTVGYATWNLTALMV
jgi:hypothetical protein